MDNKKKLEKPEVEFVKVQAEDVVAASPGAEFAVCGGGASDKSCSGGSEYNY